MIKPYPFQDEAIDFVINNKVCLLRLDTGLGKSLVSLKAANQSGCKTLLIVCPAFLKLNWENEIVKCLGKNHYIDIKIVSYTSFLRSDLTKDKFDMVVLDESQYLKNPNSKRAKNIKRQVLDKHTGRLVFSTATPVVRSAADLYFMFGYFVDAIGTYDNFRKRYCLQRLKPQRFIKWENPEYFEYYGIRKTFAHELRNVNRKCSIQMKKQDVLPELPEKIVTEVPLKISDTNKKDVNELINNEKIVEAVVALGKAKVKYVIDFINLSKEPTVVFAWHKEVVKLISSSLDYALHSQAIITGDMNQKTRMQTIDDFQSGLNNVLICTMASVAAGVNLTRATRIIFAELPWSYAALKQCADRCHRIGTKSTVNEYHLYAVDTFDEQIQEVIARKIEAEEFSVGHMR